MRLSYELMKVESWIDDKGGSGWNDCTVIDTFKTSEGRLVWNFRRRLAGLGVLPPRGTYRLERYGQADENVELQDRQSGIALFAAVSRRSKCTSHSRIRERIFRRLSRVSGREGRLSRLF